MFLFIVNYTTGGKKINNFWGKFNEEMNKPNWWPKNIPFSSPNIRSRDATDGKLFILLRLVALTSSMLMVIKCQLSSLT